MTFKQWIDLGYTAYTTPPGFSFNPEVFGGGLRNPLTVYTVEFPFPALVSGPRVTGIITAKEAVVDMPALGSMKMGFRLEYGTSSGKSKGRGWVQGTAPLGNGWVDGVCYHYELNVPADRERAEQAAATSLETEYALALADAQATQSLRTDGVDVAKPYEPMTPPDEPPFKRLRDRDIRLSYGVSGGNFWVQASATLDGKVVRGPAVRYKLENPGTTDGPDRQRAQKEAAECFHKEFAHVEAGAAIAGTYGSGEAERIRHRMCEKCGHAVLLHDDYAGCSHGKDNQRDNSRCGCMVGCKPPPVPAAFKRRTRADKLGDHGALHTPAVAQAIADGMNEKRVEEEREANAKFVTEAEAAIKEQFVVAQQKGIGLELAKLGCPGDIAAMIVAGASFTEKGDPAMLGKWAYIAGPMRGFPDFNFPAFDAAKAVLLAHGFSVISPADVDRADAGPPDPIARTRLYVMRDFWTLYLLSTWGEGDAAQFICFLEGWQCSTGATAEALLARWLSLRPLCIDGKLPSPITERPWGNVMRDFATPATV